MIVDEEVYLEHYGTKGMHWGVQKGQISRREGRKELKTYQKRHALAEKRASKDPTFKREVKAVRKNKHNNGLVNGITELELTKKGEVFTGRAFGKFTNSKGERVSTDFANAVLNRSVRREEVLTKIAAGAVLATAIIVPLRK